MLILKFKTSRAGGRKWPFFVVLKHLAICRWLPNCLFISFAFNANKKGTQTGPSIPHTMPWGRAGSVTYISQKSDSDKLLLVHFPTTRLHCSNTLAAEGAHPQLSGPRNSHGG